MKWQSAVAFLHTQNSHATKKVNFIPPSEISHATTLSQQCLTMEEMKVNSLEVNKFGS